MKHTYNAILDLQNKLDVNRRYVTVNKYNSVLYLLYDDLFHMMIYIYI